MTSFHFFASVALLIFVALLTNFNVDCKPVKTLAEIQQKLSDYDFDTEGQIFNQKYENLVNGYELLPEPLPERETAEPETAAETELLYINPSWKSVPDFKNPNDYESLNQFLLEPKYSAEEKETDGENITDFEKNIQNEIDSELKWMEIIQKTGDSNSASNSDLITDPIVLNLNTYEYSDEDGSFVKTFPYELAMKKALDLQPDYSETQILEQFDLKTSPMMDGDAISVDFDEFNDDVDSNLYLPEDSSYGDHTIAFTSARLFYLLILIPIAFLIRFCKSNGCKNRVQTTILTTTSVKEQQKQQRSSADDHSYLIAPNHNQQGKM